MSRKIYREIHEVLSASTLPKRHLKPSEEQVRNSRKLRLWAWVCIALWGVAAVEHFLLEMWPIWVTYILCGAGLAAWPLIVGSAQALQAPTDREG